MTGEYDKSSYLKQHTLTDHLKVSHVNNISFYQRIDAQGLLWFFWILTSINYIFVWSLLHATLKTNLSGHYHILLWDKTD